MSRWPRQLVAARFWSHVDKLGPVHPKLGTRCWLWTGGRSKRGGVGLFHAGRTVAAPRFAWTLGTSEAIPAGSHVCHHCDNPACVNREHLFLGTRSDNMKDCVAKGRHVSPPRDLNRVAKGEAAGQSKLTRAQVDQIRREYRPGYGSLARLAQKFRVSAVTVFDIVNFKTWA